MHFEIWQLLAIFVAAILAGIINGTVGGGSLLTYPLLVSLGISPVYAAATNSTGLSTGNGAALIPHRQQDVVRFRPWIRHAFVTAGGAVVGGLALIMLPEKIFEFLVPILLVFASLTMLIKPRSHHHEPAKPSKTLALLFGSGIYNGYFGPGQGVLAVAVLLQDGRLSVRQIIVIKNLVLATSNVIVALLFISTGHVLWPVAIALLAGVTIGGWFGGKISGSINPQFTRIAVAGIGMLSAAWFVFGR
jgi:uncharacterized membrane protein YfcA